jgi:hypothetical protein
VSAPLVALESEGSGLLASIQGYAVVDAPSAAAAVSWLKSIKHYLSRVGEVLDPIVEAAHQPTKRLSASARNSASTRSKPRRC